MANDSSVIIKDLYPLVSDSLDKNSKKFIAAIGVYMNSRSKEIHATAPYTRILYNKKDVDSLFASLGITEEEVINILKNSYFWNLAEFNPRCAREPYMAVLLCAIKYYIDKKEPRNAQITTVYTCFTGKIYASLHGLFWKFPPQEAIMDYVVNNMLSDKFDLKKEGTIFKSISKLAETWINTYSGASRSKISLSVDFSDSMYKDLVQQLRDRVKSFLNNIAKLYYEASDNKYYLNYESDDLSDENFRLTNNDAATAARITTAAVNALVSNKVDIKLCNKCTANITTVKATELCDIMEAILSNKECIPQVRRVMNILICDFMVNKDKDMKNSRVGGIDFIVYSLKAKPNTKSDILIEMKNTIVSWLNNFSVNYKKRSSRIATANDYYKCVLSYLVYTICKVSNN